MLSELTAILTPQLVPEVEHLIQDGEGSIGAKRTCLLARAQGDYIAYVDDDDLVSNTYVSDILRALDTDPDCLSLKGILMKGTQVVGEFHHSIVYKDWADHGISANPRWTRSPNHLNVVKRSIALTVGFPDQSFEEDKSYSFGIFHYLKREVELPGVQYLYRNWQK